MAHRLDKHYSDFGGTDSRSNKLMSNPRTARKGAKNWRYNFQDEIQKANGFQHKDDNTSAAACGLIEYKYTDVNTGESKSEILGVATDGILRRKVYHAIKFTSTTATSYSFYYDEVADDFKLTLNPSVATISITTSTTMNQLKTALNAVVGTTVDVVDQNGASVAASTKLAYLGNVVVNKEIAANSIVHESWFWEKVPFSNMTSTDGTEATYNYITVPFPVTASFNTSDDYEGISFINLNNVVYITDGGFPMKYDGKAVYRAGMPRDIIIEPGKGKVAAGGTTLIRSSINFKVAAKGSREALAAGTYAYAYQFGTIDYNGAETLGPVNYLPFTVTTGANQLVQIDNYGFVNGKDFPIFSCKLTGATPLSGLTLTVDSGHNILPGMCLKVPYAKVVASVTQPLATESLYAMYLSKVVSVTATTITLQVLDPDNSTRGKVLVTDQIVMGCYVPTFRENNFSESYLGNFSFNATASFMRVFRTKAGATNGPYYFVTDIPMSFKSYGDPFVGDSVWYDNIADSGTFLSLEDQGLLEDANQGEDIPRACKYLSKFQDTLVQAGRALDVSTKDDFYPSVKNTDDVPLTGNTPLSPYYTESFLCDFQSFYWADALNPEGFPQSGLNEQRIDTVFNDRITGIYPNKDAFFAFKERSTSVTTGNLSTGDLTTEILEGDYGCISHRSIQEVKGSIVWLDGDRGFYSCVAGRLPEHIGYPISDFQQINAEGLDYKKAVSANLRKENLYFCSVGSTMFVFDYSDTQGRGLRSAWYIWDRINSQDILADANDNLYVADTTRLWKLKVTNTKYDFTDHTTAIDMRYLHAWITLGEPTIDKNFQRVWINSIQGGFDLEIEQYANFLDAMISSLTINMKAEDANKKFVKNYVKAALPKLSGVSFGFRNNAKNAFVRIQGWELEFGPDYDRGEPKQ